MRAGQAGREKKKEGGLCGGEKREGKKELSYLVLFQERKLKIPPFATYELDYSKHATGNRRDRRKNSPAFNPPTGNSPTHQLLSPKQKSPNPLGLGRKRGWPGSLLVSRLGGFRVIHTEQLAKRSLRNLVSQIATKLCGKRRLPAER